ncbi:DUF3168 domain-containing protein [Aestuariibius sp. 2305UL40-4]|uniref:DUF3168 domain-containing protein n=1 Tax=Aestuariibius violaceus TaxID=3234132 RepID=UPI00345E6028
MATPSEDLQKAVFEALLADAAVAAVVGGNIFDQHPDPSNDALYPAITFGPADFVPEEMDCIDGRADTLQIDAWAREGKRLRPAKALADKVYAALHRAPLNLETHALAEIAISGVRSFMDPDGLTGHGIVTITALIEER